MLCLISSICNVASMDDRIMKQHGSTKIIKIFINGKIEYLN